MPDSEETAVVDAQAPAEPAAPTGIRAAIERARESLKSGGSIVPSEKAPAEEEAGAEEEAEEEVVEEEDTEDETDDSDDDEDDDAAGADEGEEEGEDEGDGDEEDEGEGERHVALLPGRHPDDPDIEIEVDDPAVAERINQLRNGFMRGEQIRAATAELQGAQDELYKIEEHFTYDPAGFVLENVEADQRATVALGLLVDPGVWKALEKTVIKLLDDPGELRTLQAETKAARLETRDELKKSAATRATQNENAAELRDAIDLIIPDTMSAAQRERLTKDIVRDTVDHIASHNLTVLKPKDLPTVLAERLEANGIDPLEARKALLAGKRNQGEVSTKKKVQPKPKSGKQLVKASAKRKKVAAAPGSGKKTAPTQTKKLPAGQTIQERVAEVRKRGLSSIMGNR